MATNGKQKGKRGELAWAKKLTEAGFPARRSQQYQGGNDSADITCELLDPLFHNEVKWVENLSIHKAVDQAQTDAGRGKLVYVAHKRNGKPWLVTMPADDFLELLQLMRGNL